MSRRIPDRAAEIGKRWPYRALNFLPTKQLWKFLKWKSPGLIPDSAINIGKYLGQCRKILVLMPETFPEILVSIPVLQSLAYENPDSELQILVNEEYYPFLASIFPPESLVSIQNSGLFWGETHFRDLQERVRRFQPALALTLRENTSPLLTYLVAYSGAVLRAQICSSNSSENADTNSQFSPQPFINLTIKQTSDINHLRRYILATSLWNFTPAPIHCKWLRFKPSPENMKEAQARLAGLGLRPESTRLFLWNADQSPRQQEKFTAAVTERHGPGESKALAILAATSAPFSIALPTSEQRAGIPVIEAESTGLLLALFSITAKSIGLHSPLLHLASLSDADVEAYFEPEESCWDTSFLNPRLKVFYDKRNL